VALLGGLENAIKQKFTLSPVIEGEGEALSG
jgi:hypothetical protein